MRFLWVFLAGGAAVTAVTWLSARGQSRLAGILVFIPAVSLVSYISVTVTGGADVLRPVVVRSFLSLVPLLAFLLSLAGLLWRFSPPVSLAGAMLVWFLVAWGTYNLTGDSEKRGCRIFPREAESTQVSGGSDECR